VIATICCNDGERQRATRRCSSATPAKANPPAPHLSRRRAHNLPPTPRVSIHHRSFLPSHDQKPLFPPPFGNGRSRHETMVLSGCRSAKETVESALGESVHLSGHATSSLGISGARGILQQRHADVHPKELRH